MKTEKKTRTKLNRALFYDESTKQGFGSISTLIHQEKERKRERQR